MRAVQSELKRLRTLGDEELVNAAKELGASYELVKKVAKEGSFLCPILRLVE